MLKKFQLSQHEITPFVFGLFLLGVTIGQFFYTPTSAYHPSAQLSNIWYLPAQYLPSSATDISTLNGAVNIPTSPANFDLHVCELAVFASSSGTSATITIQDKQSTSIKYFDAVTVLSTSAGSFARLIEAKGPEGCVYFKNGIKVSASAGSQIYFTMKGYW